MIRLAISTRAFSRFSPSSGTGSPEEQELTSPWTPENNFLTASNKLNRKVVEVGMEAVLEPLKLKGKK